MNYYAVIDTNVIVSSMLKHDSIPGTIIDLVLTKEIIPLLNKEILDEYSEVLTRNKFGFKKKDVQSLLNEIKNDSIFLEPEEILEDFVDEDDIVFFEIVMSAKHSMDAYLITGNIKHYPIKKLCSHSKTNVRYYSK